MLAEQKVVAQEPRLQNPARASPHHEAKAQRVIFLFMSGGPSHLELFDPKPDLQRLHGQPLPESFGPVATRRNVARNRLLGTRRTFRKYGQAGTEVSDWLPNIAQCVDDICVLRGCRGDSVTHPESVYLMNTGSILMGRASLGSWVAYGLGTESQNMPAYVVLPDPAGWVKGGAPAWGNGYLPAAYQGTVFSSGAAPIRYLNPPAGITTQQQRQTLDLVNRLNQEHLSARHGDTELSARIAAYELAFRMQAHAPEVMDASRESQTTRRMSAHRPETAEFGLLLLVRRMVERGVRFCRFIAATPTADHADVEGNHSRYCTQSDSGRS